VQPRLLNIFLKDISAFVSAGGRQIFEDLLVSTAWGRLSEIYLPKPGGSIPSLGKAGLFPSAVARVASSRVSTAFLWSLSWQGRIRTVLLLWQPSPGGHDAWASNRACGWSRRWSPPAVLAALDCDCNPAHPSGPLFVMGRATRLSGDAMPAIGVA